MSRVIGSNNLTQLQKGDAAEIVQRKLWSYGYRVNRLGQLLIVSGSIKILPIFATIKKCRSRWGYSTQEKLPKDIDYDFLGLVFVHPITKHFVVFTNGQDYLIAQSPYKLFGKPKKSK